MSTYENCYEILSDVRYGLNEHSIGLVQGTDTSGAHQNEYLLKKINKSVRFIYGLLIKRISSEFLQETTLTGSDSIFTLPWDFGRLLFFKDPNGLQVYPINPKKTKLTNETGSDRLYYRKGQTLILDKDGVNENYTLLYYRKPRDLNFGKSSAGGSQTITLETTAKALADYYNGMMIENITQGWVDTINDYSSARVATIESQIADENQYYGIVSDIPEPFHTLIAPKAVHLIKMESPVVQERVSEQELREWNRLLSEKIESYTGSDDIDYEDLFCDYEPEGNITWW